MPKIITCSTMISLFSDAMIIHVASEMDMKSGNKEIEWL